MLFKAFPCKNKKKQIHIGDSPQTNSLRILGKNMRSLRDVMAPSSVPNMESRPSVSSMRKNNTAQRGAAGNWLIASVNVMKASPVPEAD